ncbi:RecE family exodeoxyribonuclease [Serratia grimesii]|uniref:RecE family exodeoxyribonuclease n=1 Tax=Serratia grimesii TaxID=82995 RepID=UPI00217C2711|nr:RecE family exodeoxyribonuclease [Serratia grimesii]CAI0899170.1 Exodeoxyribonuclease 8 [Serratia grimesii]
MQNVYAFYLKAKQKTGKPSLFIWFDAKNDSRAQRDLANYIEDAELEEKDYFKAARTDYPVYDDLPPEGEFSETWCDCYELADDKRTWQLITSEQQQQKSVGEYFATNLDKHTVIAAAWLYGRDCLKLNEDQLKSAKALVMDDAQRYPQNVILALTSLKQYEVLYPEMPIVAIAGMKAVWLPFGKAPELGTLCKFATEYLDATVEQRADVITKWLTSTSGNKPTEQVEDLPRTSSGALASSGKEPAQGTPIDSFATLEIVTGCALYPSDFDISNPPGSIVNAVREMKSRKDKALSGWYEQLRETPGVLDFSREAIVALIHSAEENIHLTPGALRTYINTTLIEVDGKVVQQKQESTQHNDAAAQPDTSNEGGKEEVAGYLRTGAYKSERQLWLENTILIALKGETSVMSARDVYELRPRIASLTNNEFMASLIGSEVEPCDPFSQLAADEVHHLTCDLLENWNVDKERRVAFINDRVEFYLKEARISREQAISASQQENPDPAQPDAPNKGEKTEVAQQHQSGELRSMGGGHFDVSALFAESPLASVIVDEPASTKAVNLSDETAQLSVSEVTQHSQVPSAPPYFEPGRYHDIPNEVYHAANGISSTMAKDARISLMYYHGRHVIKSIKRERSDALTFGSLVHTLALEPEKLDEEFSVEPLIPEGAFTDTASMRAFIDNHNASLPKMADSDTLRAMIEKHNATLPSSRALGGNYEETAQFYVSLPVEFQSLATAEPTATAMKGCIKKYNATLPAPLKTTGSRDALLEQLATIEPEFVEKERAIPVPLPVSGSKEEMAARIKTVLPTAIFADEVISEWYSSSTGKQQITQQQMQYAKAIQRALFNHPSAGPLLQHSQRAVEVSYFGIDEETGLDVRVRPDLEIEAGGLRTGFDLKTVTMGNVKQSALRARLHREIIERDYHLSAGMYCDVAAFDQFFWIFVNKDENYHWIAIVEASADLLELGRLEYRKTLRDIKQAQDTGIWPEPITEEIVDDINDFDQRRMEALRVA